MTNEMDYCLKTVRAIANLWFGGDVDKAIKALRAMK